jgi:uncharacterized repeat protein (TIGR03803 family)
LLATLAAAAVLGGLAPTAGAGPREPLATLTGSNAGQSPQCDDGIDNDGDGLVDYPADPHCTDLNDVTERVTPIFEVVQEDLGSMNAALVVGGDGDVYGATAIAGHLRQVGDVPTIFRIDASGTFSVIHRFSASEGFPSAPAVGPDGAVYGVASLLDPGEFDTPTFFRVQGGVYTASPIALPFSTGLASRMVLGGDGAFYAALAPQSNGLGWVFEGDVARITGAGTFTLLGGNLNAYALAFPLAQGSDGAVYGTRYAGSAGGHIVRWDATGHTFIHTYTDLESFPNDFTLGGDGRLYAVVGGAGGWGTVFRFDTTGNATLLHQFSHTDGAYPYALTRGGDGAIYGITEAGGPADFGTIFRIDPTTGAFASLHSFDSTYGGAPQQPMVLASDGALYGTVQLGDAVYRVDPNLTVETYPILRSDLLPIGALVQGSDCALYGVASRWDDTTARYASTLYRVFEPGRRCQGITFDPLPDRTLGDPPFTVTATASSGLPVSFGASGSCSVTGDQVTLTGVGLCTLTASQVGDVSHDPAAEVSQSFHVRFDFTGLLPPVLDPPVVNRVKAGRSVPIRFSLGGDQGRDVLAGDGPSVRAVPCDESEPANDISGVAARRASSLRYSAKRDRYTYLWKTDKSWAGTCQELSLELTDGTTLQATFRFVPRHRAHGKHGEER